ncbi:MAG: asparaginase [Atopobiaceae bacterium]|jgi:L-asparaginase
MKKILVIATGGTIASTQNARGLTPSVSGRDLVKQVPLIADVCSLDFVQPMNIDSTNMRPENWMALAQLIQTSWAHYDGFVVLHGTDTMAYTAAALSYLVQSSEKPIVLTGSQQPMANPFTDAKLNLYQSVLYAASDLSHDVSVVFGGKAIAGTRAHKQRTMSFNAFASMNFPPLASIKTDKIFPAPQLVHANETATKPRFYTQLNSRVMVLKLTPGLDPSVLDALKENYDGLVVETFGIGGIPDSDKSWQEALFGWVDAHKTVVITTQVPEEGLDLGVYEVGRVYAHHSGILKGDDMTTEALLAKTMWVLGQTEDPEEIARLFYTPINHDRS